MHKWDILVYALEGGAGKQMVNYLLKDKQNFFLHDDPEKYQSQNVSASCFNKEVPPLGSAPPVGPML